jgi:hypothetical protein
VRFLLFNIDSGTAGSFLGSGAALAGDASAGISLSLHKKKKKIAVTYDYYFHSRFIIFFQINACLIKYMNFF